MKKLESLKHERFRVSEDELLQIKGGYGGFVGDLPTFSGTQIVTPTQVTGGETSETKTDPDACMDW